MVATGSIYDLIVVGGGPAGAAAAITAVRKGARVMLLERGRFPRHKVCGEFVSAESLDLLAGLLDSQHASILQTAIRIPRARAFIDGCALPIPVHPPAASISRLDLDAALWEVAENSGVEVRPQITVKTVTGSGPFRATTSAGVFDALAVINASGRWSNLGLIPGNHGKHPKKWLGLKAYYAEDSPPLSADLYFFEGGYCGVQPVDLRDEESKYGRVNACAMVNPDVASTLSEVFAQHPDLWRRSRGWRQLGDAVSTSPLIFRDPEPLRDGILLAGDAAGFVDPFVGDGISLALRSGALAAESLERLFRNQASLQECSNHYRRLYDERLARVFRNSAKIRRALDLPRALRVPVVSLLLSFPVAARFMVRKTR